MEEAATGAAPERRKAIGGVFSRAAPHYDLMNDVMSAGAHRLWKRRLAFHASPRAGEDWLDLACGSGDVTLLLAQGGRAGRTVGADPSEEMLALARPRVACLGGRVSLVRCAAEDMPFPDSSFDGICCAFGLRNFADMAAGLAEARRALRPGGRLFLLEFTPPRGPLADLRRRLLLEALPALGEAVAGDAASYRYLGESIVAHPGREEVAAMLGAAGFVGVSWADVACGTAAIHYGWAAP